MSQSARPLNTQGVAFGLAVAAMAALDWPYDALRDLLMEQPTRAIFMIFAPYPTLGTRILGIMFGFALATAAYWLGDRIPGRPPTWALFTIAAAGLVGLAVRSQDLSWAHDADLAVRRWIFGLAAVLLAAATVAAAIPAARAKARSRQPTHR